MTEAKKIGCSTITFRMLLLEQALQQIAEMGFGAVDIGMINRFCPHIDPLNASSSHLDELRQILENLSLRVLSLNVWSLAHLNDADGQEVELPYLKASLQIALRLGAQVVSVQAGRKVDDTRWEQDARQVMKVLGELGREARALGLRLGIEAPHKGTLAERFEDACRLIDMADPEWVGVVLDTSHVLDAGSTIEVALARYGARVCHVHLRDYLNGSILVTPGDGAVNFAKLFTGLNQLGYRGGYSLELEYQGYGAEQVRAELARARDYLWKGVLHDQ